MVGALALIFKPGFHYSSWRPELTARVDGWPVSVTRQHGRAFPLAELTGRVDGPSTRVVANRALDIYIQSLHCCHRVTRVAYPRVTSWVMIMALQCTESDGSQLCVYSNCLSVFVVFIVVCSMPVSMTINSFLSYLLIRRTNFTMQFLIRSYYVFFTVECWLPTCWCSDASCSIAIVHCCVLTVSPAATHSLSQLCSSETPKSNDRVP